ncbi:MAG: iron-containing redox enzyme family protein [Actinomycetota bacterium]|nr:iron-containing redox enzyme family protein [Actinomycetota bacterium]
MTGQLFETVLLGAVRGRRLLSHPFYQRWEAGLLEPGELADYAEQYRHVEAALPRVLTSIVSSLPDNSARQLVERNLADELGPPAHLDLFEQFASACGAVADAPASPATSDLVEVQLRSAAAGAVLGLAAVAAYEVQAAEVAGSKADGLRRHYGMDSSGTRFWDLHAALEADHADWSAEALAELGASDTAVTAAASEAAEAWWAFLDEREACRPVAA